MTSFSDPGYYQPQGSGGDEVRHSTVVLDANVSGYTAQMGQAERATRGVGAAVDSVASKMDGLAKRTGSFFERTGQRDALGLAGAAADAATLQKQLGVLNATSAVTGQSMRGIRNDVDGAFSKFPLSRSMVVGLVQDISNLGITGPRDIGAVTSTVIKLGAATGENMPQLGEQLVQLNRLMGNLDPRQIGNMANAVLTSGKNAGVSASGILQFSSAIAPIARQAGIGEAAVIGISTAFTKAGADGYVAANTFNSIVNDITTLTRTGSPELAKYASFVGLTVAQFKQLPAKDQITGIFDTIAKGGPQALTFVQELGLGTRALSAVQAVAQSGGLNQAINVALGSSTDQNNLNKGARAAFGNVSDDFARFRNELTRLGDELGGPLLTPIDLLAKGLTDFLHVINLVVKSLGPLPAILGVIAAPLSILAGALLGHAGVIGTAAAGRLLFGSGPRRAFREGQQVRTAVSGGMSEEEALALNATGQRYAAGNLERRLQVPFYLGRRGVLPSTGVAGNFVSGFRSRFTSAGIDEGATAAPTEAASVSTARMAAGMTARGVLGGPAWFLRQQTRTLSDSQLKDYQRSAYSGEDKPSLKAQAQSFSESTRARLAEAGIIKLTAQETAALGKAMAGTAAETVRAGASMAALPARAAAGAAANGLLTRLPDEMALPLRAGGQLAGRGLSALGRGARALGSAAMSPAGFLALGVGLPLAEGAWSAFRSRQAQTSEQNVIDNLNPLQQYNSALGIATQNLASFSSGLKAATPKAGAASTATSFTQAATVSHTDVAQFANQKQNDQTIAALSKHSKNDVAAGQALLNSYGITDPKQLDLFKQNLLAAGWAPDKVSQVLGGFQQGALPNFTALGAAINKTENRGAFGGAFATNASKSGNALIASGLTSIGLVKNQELGTHSAAYAQTDYLQNALGFLTGQAQGAQGTGIKALANSLATLTGGKSSEFQHILESGDLQFIPANFRQLSTAQQQSYLMSVLQKSKSGAGFLSTVTGAGGTTNLSQIPGFLAANAGAVSDAQRSAAARFGALGQYATTDQTVIAAGGAQSANPMATQQAVTGLSGEAIKAAGNFSDASGKLLELSDAMGGASTVTGQLLASAAAWTRQLQSFSLLGTSRNTQLGAAYQNVVSSRAAAMAPGATQQTVDQYKSDLGAYEQQKETYRQYLVSVYQQAQQFGVQMQRAAEDESTQEYRSKRNFYIQMQQAQADYERSTMRQRQDFATQEARQAQQAAQNIYNPFLRVQAQYTTDAGTLLQNLQDQNQRIQQQFAQLGQLRQMGVSQQAIDTLQLADPNNAQQLNNIVTSLMQNPQLVSKINAAIGTRLSATTQLTQSSFNVTFRNTVSDFNLALNRASQDYQTAHDRAVAAQSLALSDMATDYNKMIKRSAQDLATSMTEITGDFGKMFGGTMSMVNNMVARYAPGAAKIIDTELQALKDKYPGMWADADLAALTNPAVVSSSGAAGNLSKKGFAEGGISTRAMTVPVSEGDMAEAHIPLNERGQNFMTAVLVKSLAQVLSAAAPHMQVATSHSLTDASTVYSGPIEVKAADPRDMERQLAARAKLKRLTSPVRHSSS